MGTTETGILVKKHLETDESLLETSSMKWECLGRNIHSLWNPPDLIEAPRIPSVWKATCSA
jgi:hypothetical protein